MTKRNAHALQRRYTKLLATATALASGAWQFGQGVTERPWSLGLGMFGSFPAGNVPAESQTIRAKLRAVGPVVRPKSWQAIPFVSPVGGQISGWPRHAGPCGLHERFHKIADPARGGIGTGRGGCKKSASIRKNRAGPRFCWLRVRDFATGGRHSTFSMTQPPTTPEG